MYYRGAKAMRAATGGGPGPEEVVDAVLEISAFRRRVRCLARNTPKAYIRTMFTFFESAAFERYRPAYLDEDEFAEFRQFLILNPSAGAIVPGSGGVRKVRWSRSGMGK